MSDLLADHPLPKALGRMMGSIIQATTTQRDNKLTQVRNYLPHEDYGRVALLVLVRITGTLDRCFILVNVALDLGNGPEDCRYGPKRKNKHVTRTNVSGPLAEINRIVKPYREQRNVVAHRRRYSEDRLRTLEMFHLVGKSDPDEKWDYVAKLEADRVVSEKRREMNSSIRALQKAVSKLLSILQPEVMERFEHLKPM